MHGIGNDYVFVNGFEQPVDDPEGLAPRIADRHFGVGGDGLILLLPPEQGVDAHVRMRMFNADGSEAEMCGNGVRCICKLAHDHGICDANPMRVQTGHGVLTLSYTTDATGKVDQVTVDMGEPILEAGRVPVSLAGVDLATRVIDHPIFDLVDWSRTSPPNWYESAINAYEDIRITCVSMGNPHVVIYCDNLDEVPVASVGRVLETHAMFPSRVNIHFVKVHSPGEVTMQTWERGSGRTLACGTGASAVCVAGVLTGRGGRELIAHLPGGDLSLECRESNGHVYMTGPATEVFTGEWSG
jgi:diaminopimelate epimerase